MSDTITRKEFHNMERRILSAIKDCAVNTAGLDAKVEANRLNINRTLGVNAVLTAIGSSIATAFGINN